MNRPNMQIRILGSLLVTRDGSPVVLGGPRQQRVLAVLTSQKQQPVSTDRLIEGVWDAEPPRTARKTLHGYIHHLRSEFGDAIQTHKQGYLLNLDDGQVDGWRFGQLAEEALASSEVDPANSIKLCSDALGLWTGLAYEGFEDSSILEPEIVRLTERRLEIVELRLDARITLGQASSTIAELESLTRQYPYRERFRLFHMTALYRAGRQAEALRAFEQTRGVLVEQLGLEPGPELQHLHQQILTHDPILETDSPRAQLGPAARRSLAANAQLTVPANVETLGLRGYELRGVLAQDEHRSVYRAFHASVGREVVIRATIGPAANSTRLIECFEDEIRRLGPISQPAGALVLDAWREPDAVYYVEPWLGGGSLQTRLDDESFASSDIVGLLEGIAAPLRQAHQLGFCHGQLAPSSVRFDDEGQVHLVGFSIEGLDRLAAGGDWLSFAAPEVRNTSTPLVPESDVYSLGVLVLHMLDVSEDTAPSDFINDHLKTAISVAVEENPAKRYTSVDAFVSSFVHALSQPTDQPRLRIDQQTLVEGASRPGIRNPYKGLRAFQQSDSRDFFGREHTIQQVSSTMELNRFVAIVGPSGVGKSSLVKAGLIPAIRQSAVFGNPAILVAEMFPGRYPFEEMLTALTGVAVVQPLNGLEQLMSGTAGLGRVLNHILPDDGRELLLVIDQFEELFSLATNEAERSLFISSLVAAVTSERSRLRVIITLRADYYDRPLEFADLGALLEVATIPIRAPDVEGLRKAIETPAISVGLRLGPSLVDQIVDDVAKQPGGLPLMQYALAELVDERTSDLLTVEAYQEMGGVLGAVATRAEEIWQDLSPPEQRAIRQVFLRLVTIDETATGMRRRAHRRELSGLTISQPDLERTLQAYGEHRLLSFDRDPITRGPTIEVAHEALLQQWPRLRLWISEERERLILRRRLVTAMAEWESSGRDASYVLRGSRLAQYGAWEDERSLMLTSPERQFLKIGQELRDEEAHTERRTNRRLRSMLTGAIAFAIIALLAGTFGIIQAGRAEREAQVAEANRIDAEVGRLALRAPQLLESDRQVALLLAVEAVRRVPDPVSYGALQEVLAQTDGLLGILATDQRFDDVAFTPGGNLVGLARDQLTVFFPDADWQSVSWPLTGATSFAVDPSRERVVVADALGVRVLDLPDTVTAAAAQFAPPLLDAAASHVTILAYNSDGSMLGVGDAAGVLTLANISSGRHQTWAPHPETDTAGAEIPAHQPDKARLGIRALAFSDDGLRVATGGLVFARVWDIASQTLVQDIHLKRSVQTQESNAAVRAIRFDSDDDQILVASSYGARRHEIESGLLVHETRIEGRALAIGTSVTDSSVSLSEDAVTLSLQGGVIVITPFDGQPEVRIDAQVSGDTALAASPTGEVLAISNAEGIVLWSTAGRGLIRRAIPRLGASDVAFGHEGQRIALSSPLLLGLRYLDVSNGQETRLPIPLEPRAQYGWTGDKPGIIFWNLDTSETFLRTGENLAELQLLTPNVPRAIARHDDLIAFGLVSPDGPSFIQVVSTNGDLVAELDDLGRIDPEGGVATLSFSADGGRLVANTERGAAVAWETASWQLETVLAHGGGQIVITGHSPDGRFLMTTAEDGTILMRDPNTFQQVGPPLIGQVDGISGFSYGPGFSDDGRFMFTGGDGRLRIWDLNTRLQIGEGFPTDAGSAATSSGRSLTGSTIVGDHVFLWNLDIGTWVDIACEAAGRNLTTGEWQQFGAKDDPYPITCPQWPSDAGATEDPDG